MNMTLGEPSFALTGSGQAGLETSKVRPMTPENAVPDLYSFKATRFLPNRCDQRSKILESPSTACGPRPVISRPSVQPRPLPNNADDSRSTGGEGPAFRADRKCPLSASEILPPGQKPA